MRKFHIRFLGKYFGSESGLAQLFTGIFCIAKGPTVGF